MAWAGAVCGVVYLWEAVSVGIGVCSVVGCAGGWLPSLPGGVVETKVRAMCRSALYGACGAAAAQACTASSPLFIMRTVRVYIALLPSPFPIAHS